MDKPHYDIRWQQRLEHFTLLLSQLEEVSGQKIESMRIIEIAGWIHIFDLTFELAWKTMRDYMVFRGESERLDFTRDILQVALMR
jgi:Nucleotidyltransferase substrate binding protein like